MITKKDLRKLNRLAANYNRAEATQKEAEQAIIAIVGWDFTNPCGPFDSYYDPTEDLPPPDNGLLLGYLGYLLNFGGGRLKERYRHHLFAQYYAHDKANPINALREADNALSRDHDRRHTVREGDFKTLLYKCEYWETVYRFQNNEYWKGERPPATPPLTQEQSDEIIAQNKRFIIACAHERKLDDQIEEILWYYALHSKEGYEAYRAWTKENGISPYMCGSHIIENHWNGQNVKTEEELQLWRDDRQPKSKKLAIGTDDVKPPDAPGGTYLKEKECGCIVRRLTDREIIAMNMRRNGGNVSESAYSDNSPWMRLVKPGAKCLKKIRCQGDRYKLGAHERTCGTAVLWNSHDPLYTVVEKPEKFDSRATSSSHPDLETEWEH